MNSKDKVGGRRGERRFLAGRWAACCLLAACMGGCAPERSDGVVDAVPAIPTVVAATPTPYAAVPTYTPTPIIRIDVRLPPGTPTPTPTPQRHVVEAGDTLIGIAARYGVAVADLQELNGVVDPRSLQIGQRLEIPVRSIPEEDANPVRARHELRRVAVAVDGLGIAWVMGEVVNLEAVPVEQIRVAARLQAADDTELTRRTALAVRHITPPGEAAPFMFRLGKVSQTIHGWTLAVASIKPAHIGGYATALSVGELRFEQQPSGTVLVSGLVANHETVAVADPEVVVTALDDQRRVTAVRAMLPGERVLAPDDEVAFDGVLIPLGEPVADVTAFAQGFRSE